jgi:hypothetical protein
MTGVTTALAAKATRGRSNPRRIARPRFLKSLLRIYSKPGASPAIGIPNHGKIRLTSGDTSLFEEREWDRVGCIQH